MKKTKYRFRTREEFVRKFGKDWENNVECSWQSADEEGEEMDYFFGKAISNANAKKLLEGQTIKITCPTGDWTISKDMICEGSPVKVKPLPGYKLFKANQTGIGRPMSIYKGKVRIPEIPPVSIKKARETANCMLNAMKFYNTIKDCTINFDIFDGAFDVSISDIIEVGCQNYTHKDLKKFLTLVLKEAKS